MKESVEKISTKYVDNKPAISTIIVNHNGKKYLKEIINSVKSQTLEDIEIIVSDTDSTDGSREFIENTYSDVKFLSGPNRGYGYACNRGAEISKGKYLAFFNEDMKLPPDYMRKLFDYHVGTTPESGGVTATYLVDNGDPVELAKTHPGKIDIFGFPVDSDTPDSVVVPGSPFFLSSDLFRKTKGFNENIFMYGEDVDYSWRMKIFGYSVRLYKGTCIQHFGGGSGTRTTTKGLFNIITSGFIPSFCNFGTALFLISVPLSLVFITFSAFALFIYKKFDLSVIRLYRDFLASTVRKLPSLIKMRRFVQTNRKLSDVQVLKSYIFVPAFIYNKIVSMKDRHGVL